MNCTERKNIYFRGVEVIIINPVVKKVMGVGVSLRLFCIHRSSEWR